MDSLFAFFQFDSFQPSDLLVVLTLIVLEGLLSCDNAVALALVVRRLPREQQGKALRYGIVGAYTFLIIALLLATWIMTQWWLKMLGGAYLLWMAFGHFLRRAAVDGSAHLEPVPARRILGLSAFWSTVVMVEFTDVAFSVDSIAAAVALSDKFWILLIGTMIAVLAMRFAAQGFVKLLHHFPHLETAAFLAVGVIGLKLALEIPGDVVGRTQLFPTTVTYHTAEEYRLAVETNRHPLFVIPHFITVQRDAAPPPNALAITDTREYTKAHTQWVLHGRALIKLDDEGSSALVLILFGLGFLKRTRTVTP